MARVRHGYSPYAAQQQTPRRAFTLIEVLVVVAIIALLIAVLIPSLQMAREQAKLTTDKANCKQIATMNALYQTENQGYVPVMYTHASGTYEGGNSLAAARVAYLSLALRFYDSRTKNIKRIENGKFDPDKHWTEELRLEYQRRFLPDLYICPFDRGKGDEQSSEADDGTVLLSGRREFYVTWMAEESDLLRGAVAGAGKGRVKYTSTTWNRLIRPPYAPAKFPDGTDVPPIPGEIRLAVPQTPENTREIVNAHRMWSGHDARRLRCASLSELAVAYCAKGAYYSGSKHFNPDSHRSGTGPGTQLIFADTHVEWVRNNQVNGW